MQGPPGSAASAQCADFSQQEEEAPAGAIMYPDFLAWLDATGAEYNSAGSSKGNMFQTLAKGLGTMFRGQNKGNKGEGASDSSGGEGEGEGASDGSGPARRSSMTERIRASFSAAIGSSRSKSLEEMEEMRAAEEALRKQRSGERKLSALEMMAAKRKARGGRRRRRRRRMMMMTTVMCPFRLAPPSQVAGVL